MQPGRHPARSWGTRPTQLPSGPPLLHLTTLPFFEGGPRASWGQSDALIWEFGMESQFLVGGSSLLDAATEAREPWGCVAQVTTHIPKW